jgi:hypothetical protein
MESNEESTVVVGEGVEIVGDFPLSQAGNPDKTRA